MGFRGLGFRASGLGFGVALRKYLFRRLGFRVAGLPGFRVSGLPRGLKGLGGAQLLFGWRTAGLH